jgi:hypothetical protein
MALDGSKYNWIQSPCYFQQVWNFFQEFYNPSGQLFHMNLIQEIFVFIFQMGFLFGMTSSFHIAFRRWGLDPYIQLWVLVQAIFALKKSPSLSVSSTFLSWLWVYQEPRKKPIASEL